MRFRHPDGSIVHLAYCANVHPTATLAGLMERLDTVAAAVRARLGVARLGVGLWIPAPVARELRARRSAVNDLRRELRRGGLETVTMNGFPYRAFEAPVVKRSVYQPDWTQPERLAYTLDLAWLLAELLPDDCVEGSISTLPLGWRVGWDHAADVAAAELLGRLAEGLAEVAERTGRRIRVAIEPEPGCAVETIEGVIAALEGIDREWVGVCMDSCHLAVQFEDPRRAVEALRQAGISVVKAQLSSALRLGSPADAECLAQAAAYAEPRFLHQTRHRAPSGAIEGVDDLPDALSGGLATDGEWRVHFHLPVHVSSPMTTQNELEGMLEALLGTAAPVTHHLELETYTWTVLPPDQRPADDAGLVEGIARELDWVRRRVTGLGLKEVTM